MAPIFLVLLLFASGHLATSLSRFDEVCQLDLDCDTRRCHKALKRCVCPETFDYAAKQVHQQTYNVKRGLCESPVGMFCSLVTNDGFGHLHCVQGANCTRSRHVKVSRMFGICLVVARETGISGEKGVVVSSAGKGRQFENPDCCHTQNAKVGWERVVIPLIKVRYLQLETVHYAGCDPRGTLCTGVEFDNNIGGMSGKISGHRIFECRRKHGLLIPVEYVSFLNSPSAGSSPNNVQADTVNVIHRTRSVPTLNRSVSVRDFEPEEVPGLRIGDTVVWLGGLRPLTGVVKWVVRDGRSKNIPLKVWVEMDDHIDEGYDEFALGFTFGCAQGRGRLLSVDELIFLVKYLPVENVSPTSGCRSPTEKSCPVSMDLIDFGQKPDNIKRRNEAFDTNEVEYELINGIKQIAPSNPTKPLKTGSPTERIIPIFLESSGEPIQQNQDESEPEPRSASPVGTNDLNPSPPYILPTIQINDFFQAEGLRGIQGRRNSCYIDVALFAMFAFSDTFDSYFLEITDPASSMEETEMKRICRKVL